MPKTSGLSVKLLRSWENVSLRNKITGVTVVILFFGLVLAGAGTLSVLHQLLIGNEVQTLQKIRDNPQEVLALDSDLNSLRRVDVLYASTEYYVAMLDNSGKVQYDNFRSELNGYKPLVSGSGYLKGQHTGNGVFTLRSEDKTEWFAVALPVYANSQQRGILLVAVSTAMINQVMAHYVVIFTGFGIAVILLGGALTRVLVTLTFNPLAEVERTALEIARGNYSQRIMISNPNTEVGHLGESLNVMLDRLDGSLADRADTIKNMRRFIGDASHELRTPLASVRGYAELFRMGALSDDVKVAQAMERIEKEAIRMTSLVEDLLALARLDERRPLELAPLMLNQIVADAALDARARATEREITVFPAPVPACVLGDEHKVRQLITNLLGNAIRHTPEGSAIELVVCAAQSKNGQDVPEAWSVEVVDHGEGVPKQLREKIFDRFWRVDNSRNRETGGSGLGLAIVRSIVQAHNGNVAVVETPGGGATFRVTLPAAPVTPESV